MVPQLRRSRSGDAGRASGPPASRAGHHPALRLSRGRPHIIRIDDNRAAGETPRRSRPRRSRTGSSSEANSRDEPKTRSKVHPLPPAFDAGRRQPGGLRRRRRHGRGAHQYRPDRGTIDIKSVAGEGLPSPSRSRPDLSHRLGHDRGSRAANRLRLRQLSVVELSSGARPQRRTTASSAIKDTGGLAAAATSCGR